MWPGVGKLQANHDQCRQFRPFFINAQDVGYNGTRLQEGHQAAIPSRYSKFENASAPTEPWRMGLNQACG